MLTLTDDNVTKMVDYLVKVNQRAQANTDELARRMGINPETDILVMPVSRVNRDSGVLRLKFLPRWLSFTSQAKEPKLIEGVRNAPRQKARG